MGNILTLSTSSAALRLPPRPKLTHVPEGQVRPAGHHGARHRPRAGFQQSCADPCKMGCEGPSPGPRGHGGRERGQQSRAGAATNKAILPGGSDGLTVLKGKKPRGRQAHGGGCGGPGLTRSWRALCHGRGHVHGRESTSESETLRLPTSADASTPPRPPTSAQGNVPRSTVPCSNICPAHPQPTDLSESGEESVHHRRLPMDGVSDAVPLGHSAAEETQDTFKSS